jgi:hypothetical protein
MRKPAITLLVVSLLLGACRTESGSGTVATRQIDVGSFSSLQVSHAFTVNVTVGSPEEVTVRVDDNLIDILDVGVSDGTLRIGLESGTEATDATLEADVSVPSLDALELSGASRATVSGSATSLDAAVSGASNLAARGLTIDELTIDVSGASSAEVTVTGTLSATASGASTLRYAGSPSVDESDASGASTIEPV